MISIDLLSLLVISVHFVGYVDAYCGMRGVPETFSGPSSPSDFASWLASSKKFRDTTLAQSNYSGTNYDLDILQWTQHSFVQPQLMVHDRFFYDVTSQKYTVKKYLNDVRNRYGGIDSILLWHSYPNIGVDDRNQFEILVDLPGGPTGLQRMIEDFHSEGVSVLFPYNPWDQGTRDNGESDSSVLNQIWDFIGADGFNGDTCSGVSQDFFRSYHPLGIQPEVGLGDYRELEYNVLSWGYWSYPTIPAVSTYKWLERRHMVDICDRWSTDKTGLIQHALFNGVGIESWENIWGIWNGLSPRDSEAIRRVSSILRQFSRFVVSSDWEPHTPVLQDGIYASKFPLKDQILYTLVNRMNSPSNGTQIAVPNLPGYSYFDVYHGTQLQVETEDGDQVKLSFFIEPNGYGAVFITNNITSDLKKFLIMMQQMTEKPLISYDTQPKILQQTIVPIPSTQPTSITPPDMIRIPGGTYQFTVTGIEIEGPSYTQGVDCQYPWENSPSRYHNHTLTIGTFFIDQYPVTNTQFMQFMNATQYNPTDNHNFLKHWIDGNFPASYSNKPVIWVSIEDARVYCQWAGKRLVHEWEWQYAAQGGDSNRTYPWGNIFDSKCVPPIDIGRVMGPPADVDAYPCGVSPFGVQDMIGNVYQWTEEFMDDHTRTAIIRGGNHYQAQGSQWYLPQNYELIEHQRFLLMAPSLDRSAGIGFRCAKDSSHNN